MIESAKNPASHKYSQFRGNANFKEAASQFYKDNYQVDLDSEKEICVLGGAKIGLVEFPVATMNPGDLLLLPDPGYPDYLSSVSLGKIEFETFPLKAENEFLPDLSAIPEDVAKRAKFIYINYLTILPELWQRQHFMKNWLLGRKNSMLVWSVTLPMVPWERMVLKIQVFYQRQVQKKLVLNSIHFLKLLTWQVGVWLCGWKCGVD